MQSAGLKVWPLSGLLHVYDATRLLSTNSLSESDWKYICVQELLTLSSPSGASCTTPTPGQRTSPAGEGDVFAFINALQATPAVQTLHILAVLKNLWQHSSDACRGSISFHGGPRASCGQSYSASCSAEHLPHLSQDPRLHLSSASTPPFPSGGDGACPTSGPFRFLDGLFNPTRTGAELATLAKNATERLRVSIMVATNGRVALSGVKVSKQAQGNVAIKDADIEAMFAELDVNQNGYIDKVEFLKAFDRMGLPANTEYLR